MPPLLLIYQSAFQRAEHRKWIRGEEAPMSERSEFGAVPWFTEKRREPVHSTGSRSAACSLVTFLQEQEINKPMNQAASYVP